MNDTVLAHTSPDGVLRPHKRGKLLFLTVGCINYDCDVNFYEPLKEIFAHVINYNYMDRLKHLGRDAMNAEVIEIARTERPPDVLLHAYQDQIAPETLDTLRRPGTRVTAWFSDDHWRFASYSRHIAEHVSCSITTDSRAVDKYRALGLNVVRSQWGANHRRYRKMDCRFLYDVSFVGNNYGRRQENLLHLQQHQIPVAVFGKSFGRYVTFAQMIALFNASRINLNFTGSSRDDDVKQIKGRIFEVPVCGGFLLTEHVDGLDEYFEIGTEIETFRDMSEATEKIQYYLRHEDERRQIAERGYARALREHTWIKRLGDIFDELDRMDGKFSPAETHVGRQVSRLSRSPAARHTPDRQSRKRVLLTTSAAPAQSPFSTKEKRPPLGIGFLISTLRNAGHQVFFIDNYLQPSDFLETDYLRENAIDFVGIYANTICFRDTLRMLGRVQHLRQTHQWGGEIIVGGPHAAVAPQTIPDWVDYVVQGEGERAICDVVEGRVADRLIRYPRIENLDELPTPAWDCFVNLPYQWDVNFFEDRPVFTMNTSRGCPFQCTFCSVGSVWGKRYTCFSADRIVSDIEQLIGNYGAKGIYFREDNFTLDEKRLRRFCDLMIERGIRIPWVCESRVSTLTRETVERMVQAGLKGVYFGVESGSQRMLDFMKKGITVGQIENAFQWCHELNVKAAASVVVGVPGETEADLVATQELLKRIKPVVVWPNVFVGIPDSRLYQYALNKRLYEYVDDRGLVYLSGHNDRVRRYYGDGGSAGIPDTEEKKDWAGAPKVSVLMAVHDGEKFVQEAIASLYGQTYQDFELIVVDDGSTDATPEILQQVKDSRTFIYRNAENQGLTKSLNKGLRLCRGDYVARMDADDVSAPERFARQVAFLEGHPGVALVGTPYYHIDAQGTVTAQIEVPTEDDQIREALKEKNCFGHGTIVARRSALVACGGYDERFVCAQDYDLWLRIAEKHRLANLGEPLYYWRSTEECISHAKRQEQQHYKDLATREAQSRRGEQDASERAKHLSGSDKQPLVSVIVPTCNRPEMLKRAIESILGQTYPSIEIVVVNDGGDDAEHIIRALNTRSNILYLRHAGNKGQAAARNMGIRAAHGKYIAYLDDDDIYYPDHIERLVTSLETTDYRVAHTQACRSHQEKRDGCYVETHKTTPYTTDVIHEGLLVCNLVPVLCVMHEKSCLDEVGCFDETLPTHEDWDLWIRMSRKYEFLHISHVTAEVTWRTDGTTMTSRRVREFLTVPEIVYNKYRQFVADKPHIAALQAKRLQLLRRQSENPPSQTTDCRTTPAGEESAERTDGAQVCVPSRGSVLNIAVKICTPSREESLWGDTWFGYGLAKALWKAGHQGEVHFRNEWDRPDPHIDVAIHVKGLAQYTPKPNGLNVMWIISHPELHSPEQLNQFDAVFCASRKYCEYIAPKIRVPRFYLPQATDDEIFRPLDPGPAKDIDVLFVGNNYCRERRRPIINDLFAVGRDYDLWIIGLGWRGYIDEKYLKADHLHPQELPTLYSRAKIVLNDHHETMRQWGFINDRTYNLAAVKAFQICTRVEGLDELGIVTYSSPEDLRRKLDYYLQHHRERERMADIAHERCRPFTFTEAAKAILGVIHRLPGQSSIVRHTSGHPVRPQPASPALAFSGPASGR